jgi:hypothetical protein
MYGYTETTEFPRAGSGAMPAEPQGRLILDVSPLSAQVFVDGYYRGVVEEFSGRGLELDAGPHRIELRADGYETVTFDVRIDGSEAIDYAKAMAPAAPETAATSRPAPAKQFYVIPGCYAGDKRPNAAQLPKGCRASNVRIVPPVLSSVGRQ